MALASRAGHGALVLVCVSPCVENPPRRSVVGTTRATDACARTRPALATNISSSRQMEYIITILRRLPIALGVLLASIPLSGSALARTEARHRTNATLAATHALDYDCRFHFGRSCSDHNRVLQGSRRHGARRLGGKLPPGWVQMPWTVEEDNMTWVRCGNRAEAYSAAWLAPKALLVGERVGGSTHVGSPVRPSRCRTSPTRNLTFYRHVPTAE